MYIDNVSQENINTKDLKVPRIPDQEVYLHLTTMQLLLRTLHARTTTLSVDNDANVVTLKTMIQEKEGVPVNDQVLMCGAKALQGEETLLTDLGVERGATVHLSCRLRGGKPVKVKMMTNHLPCGSEVTIDLEPNATKNEIKRKLEVATGVPVEHQKVMLSGINQITMGDKRTNLQFSSCGTSNGVQLAVGK